MTHEVPGMLVKLFGEKRLLTRVQIVMTQASEGLPGSLVHVVSLSGINGKTFSPRFSKGVAAPGYMKPHARTS